MTAPVGPAGPVHIWASHKDAQAAEGPWRLCTLNDVVLVGSTTDHVKDAGEALRARGDVSPDALVTIYSPSSNVCWSGPLKEMCEPCKGERLAADRPTHHPLPTQTKAASGDHFLARPFPCCPNVTASYRRNSASERHHLQTDHMHRLRQTLHPLADETVLFSALQKARSECPLQGYSARQY